jgi:hypothetical protein
MNKTIRFAMALGLIMLFSGIALADSGQCSYATHAKRTMAQQDESSKTVAAKDATKTDGNKLVLVQKEDPIPSPVPQK